MRDGHDLGLISGASPCLCRGESRQARRETDEQPRKHAPPTHQHHERHLLFGSDWALKFQETQETTPVGFSSEGKAFVSTLFSSTAHAATDCPATALAWG